MDNAYQSFMPESLYPISHCFLHLCCVANLLYLLLEVPAQVYILVYGFLSGWDNMPNFGIAVI